MSIHFFITIIAVLTASSSCLAGRGISRSEDRSEIESKIFAQYSELSEEREGALVNYNKLYSEDYTAVLEAMDFFSGESKKQAALLAVESRYHPVQLKSVLILGSNPDDSYLFSLMNTFDYVNRARRGGTEMTLMSEEIMLHIRNIVGDIVGEDVSNMPIKYMSEESADALWRLVENYVKRSDSPLPRLRQRLASRSGSSINEEKTKVPNSGGFSTASSVGNDGAGDASRGKEISDVVAPGDSQSTVPNASTREESTNFNSWLALAIGAVALTIGLLYWKLRS